MNSMKRSNQEGFTLLEVLISLAVFSIGVLAVVALQTSAIQGNSSANHMTEASILAQDKVEELMTLPITHAFLNDQDGDDGGAGVGGGLDDVGFDGNPGTQGDADYQITQDNNFYSVHWNVARNYPNTNNRTIRVIVTWNQGGRARSVSFDCVR